MDFDRLTRRLGNSTLPPSVLLCKAHFPNDFCKAAAALNDPRYLNFYYYLGMELGEVRVCEPTFTHGLQGACFLQGCATTVEYLGLSGDFNQFADKTIREVYGGDFQIEKVTDRDNWDVVLITEEGGDFEFWWERLRPGGLLVVDYIDSGNKSFSTFCKVRNREPKRFDTRYGTNILVR